MSTADNKRMARNTIFLYLRSFVSMVISLYTSRKILEILGVDDFGILNVVGGVIAMFTFLSGSMSVATQRFLTFELGRGEGGNYKHVFSMTCIIHGLLALIFVLLGETIGLWFVNTQLNIPVDRMVAANAIYQMSIASVAVGILQTPYNASIVSYERMHVYAYVGMGEAFAKLLIVYLLLISPIDKLITYSLLFFCVQLTVCVIYRMYCIRNFPGCHISLEWDHGLFKSIAGFTGWNMFGTVAWLFKDSGTNVLLNIFGGPAVNAARGIASQVINATTVLVNGFQNAVNPQLVKSYASDDKQQTCSLLCRSSKFSYYLIYIIALPVLFECDFLLDLWLVDVPAYAVLFTRIVLLDCLIGTLSGPMITALMATGNIKWYQIVVGSFILVNLPVSWLFLRAGYHISIPLIVSLIVVSISNVLRLLFCKKQLGLSIRHYCRMVVLPVASVTIISGLIMFVAHSRLGYGWLCLVLTTVVSTGSILTSIYAIGLDRGERVFLLNTVRRLKIHKLNRYKI